MSFNARHVHEVFKGARLTPWTKYSDAEIEQLAALRRLYQKHFNCVLEVWAVLARQFLKALTRRAAGEGGAQPCGVVRPNRFLRPQLDVAVSSGIIPLLEACPPGGD